MQIGFQVPHVTSSVSPCCSKKVSNINVSRVYYNATRHHSSAWPPRDTLDQFCQIQPPRPSWHVWKSNAEAPSTCASSTVDAQVYLG